MRNEVKCTIKPEEVAKVKGLGCLRDKTTENCFNCRVLTGNGKMTAAQSRAVAEAAERYGSGEIALTARQTVEIQKVPFENIEPLRAFLKERGLETGGTGPKVRPVVSCKGTTCVYGLIDTSGLALKIHERFYEGYHSQVLPHKFKIAVGGCPNNCVKPELNDIGVIGQCVFAPDYGKCAGCRRCAAETACPMNALSLKEGVVALNEALCNNCGRCINKCPFGVFANEAEGYRVYIGGRWGKKTGIAKPLNRIFQNEEEVLAVIEKAIIFFRDNGIKGERFADTIERLGFEYVESKLL